MVLWVCAAGGYVTILRGIGLVPIPNLEFFIICSWLIVAIEPVMATERSGTSSAEAGPRVRWVHIVISSNRASVNRIKL